MGFGTNNDRYGDGRRPSLVGRNVALTSWPCPAIAALAWLALGCAKGHAPAGDDDAATDAAPGADAAITGQPSWQAIPLRSRAQKNAGLPGGEGMQMIQSFAYAPSNPNTVYMVVDTSQVWKSTDGGSSWESKRNGFRASGGVSIAVDPRNEDVVFVSGALPVGGSPVDGIYRTLDGGDSWNLLRPTYYLKREDGFDYAQGQHYAFDSRSFDGTRHKTVYAGTNAEGLLKSTDGGATWEPIALAGKRVVDLEAHETDGQMTLYVATTDGLHKVTDRLAGEIEEAPLGDLPGYPRTLALNSREDPSRDILFAAVGTSQVYRSLDGGATFQRRSTGLPMGPIHQNIVMSPADPDRLYVKLHNFGPGLYYTGDGGATWTRATDLNVGNLLLSPGNGYHGTPIVPHPTDPLTAITHLQADRLIKTTDGGQTWAYSGNGYMGARRSGGKTTTHFDLRDPDRMIFFLIDHGPVLTEDGGESWTMLLPERASIPEATGKTTPVGAVHPLDPDIIVTAVGGWSSQILARSADGGGTWVLAETAPASFAFLMFHPEDGTIVYAGTKAAGGWISRDSGVTWSQTVSPRGVPISIRSVFPGDADVVYAVETPSSESENVSLWRSDDTGRSWNGPIAAPFGTVGDMDIDPDDPGRLYVAAGGGLYRLDGDSWMEIGRSNGIEGELFGSNRVLFIRNVVVDPNRSNVVYAGLRVPGIGHPEAFIYRSEDRGQTWENFRLNLDGYSNVWSLAVDPRTSELLICLDHGNYVLKGNAQD